MLRFILKNTVKNDLIDLKETTYTTIDLNVIELEKLLTDGGSGEHGYDRTELVGVEVIKGN